MATGNQSPIIFLDSRNSASMFIKHTRSRVSTFIRKYPAWKLNQWKTARRRKPPGKSVGQKTPVSLSPFFLDFHSHPYSSIESFLVTPLARYSWLFPFIKHSKIPSSLPGSITTISFCLFHVLPSEQLNPCRSYVERDITRVTNRCA